jgi:hypothetical protein
MGLPLRHRAISNFSIFNDQNKAYELHEIQSFDDDFINSQSIHQHLIRSNARMTSKEQSYELRPQICCSEDNHTNPEQSVDTVNPENQSQKQANNVDRYRTSEADKRCSRTDWLGKMVDEWPDGLVKNYHCSSGLVENHRYQLTHEQHAVHNQPWKMQQGLFFNKSFNGFKLESRHVGCNTEYKAYKTLNENSRKKSIQCESSQQALEKVLINDPGKHPGGWSGYSRARTRMLFRYDAFTFFIKQQRKGHGISRSH